MDNETKTGQLQTKIYQETKRTFPFNFIALESHLFFKCLFPKEMILNLF
jgi:hypothetical protein